MAGLLIKAADQADVGVAGMKLQTDGVHLLRGDQQHLLAVEREKVRTFPHTSVLIVAGGHDAHKFPMLCVAALKQQNLTAAVSAPVAHHGIKGLALAPDFRVAEIVNAVAFGNHRAVNDRVAGLLSVIHAVADRDALGLEGLNGSVASAHIAHTCVHQQMTPVGQFHRAAGEAAVPVIVGIRSQCRGQTLPADKVAGLYMAPVHGTPFGIVGVVLKKQMVLALVRSKAVGIVDPADTAGHMEVGQLGTGIGQIFGFKITGAL